MPHLYHYDHGIHAFDSGCFRPLCAAIHLIVENGRVAIVETGHNDSLPQAELAIAQLGLTPEAVDWIVVTHVHLDHAGGAGSYMAAFPNAKLAVHPRGAKHMIEPDKLWAGVVGVYGEEAANRMYGKLKPIPAERVVEAGEGKVLSLAGRELVCIDTPGHAQHHLCLIDTKSGCIFTGDTFGLSYRELDTNGRPWIFPTTTPVQFDPEAMHKSIDRIVSYQPPKVYLTHFSELGDVPRLAEMLHRQLDNYVALALREKDAGPERHQRLVEGMYQLMAEEGEREGWIMPEPAWRKLLSLDVELNCQGLGVWLDKQAAVAKA